jgi:hypothetical protein
MTPHASNLNLRPNLAAVLFREHRHGPLQDSRGVANRSRRTVVEVRLA